MSRPRRAAARLLLPAAGAWGAAAFVVAGSVHVAVLSSVVAGLAAAAAYGLARGARRPLAAGLAALAVGGAVGAGATAIHLAALQRGPVAVLAREHRTALLAARLVRDPLAARSRTGHPLTVIDATAYAVRAGAGESWQRTNSPVVLIALAGRWSGLLPGQRLTVEARLRPPRPGDVVSAVGFVAGDPGLVGRPPIWQRWAGRVRTGLRTACERLSADARGLVPGLVLGDVAAMSPELTDDFRATGLTHLCAVSGANVAIVLGAVLAVVRLAGLGRRTRAVAAAAALAGFVVLVRPSPSVLRAAVMGLVVLVGAFTGRRAAALPSLSAAVLVLLLVDPFLARTPGFAMSVLATAAIVVVAPAWTRRLSEHLPRSLAAAVAVPAAAQLACMPVLVAAFGQLTPLAVPANFLAAPAVAPATIAGVVAALTAVVSPTVARAPAWLAGIAADWLAVVARTLAAIPGAGLHGPAGSGGVALVAGMGIAGWVVVRVVRRRRRAMLGGCRP